MSRLRKIENLSMRYWNLSDNPGSDLRNGVTIYQQPILPLAGNIPFDVKGETQR